jgi:hypothetical protein
MMMTKMRALTTRVLWDSMTISRLPRQTPKRRLSRIPLTLLNWLLSLSREPQTNPHLLGHYRALQSMRLLKKIMFISPLNLMVFCPTAPIPPWHRTRLIQWSTPLVRQS